MVRTEETNNYYIGNVYGVHSIKCINHWVELTCKKCPQTISLQKIRTQMEKKSQIGIEGPISIDRSFNETFIEYLLWISYWKWKYGEFLLGLSGLQTQLVSMRMQVGSLASLSGLRIQHCRDLRCRSQTLLRSGIDVAYGSSQVRGQNGAAAVGLHHSHSHTRFEERLWPTPDPYPTGRGQGSNPHLHGH